MSKKGVSAEEKRSRLLQLFYEKGECFQLKELEKIAPKEKGITANSVKEVLQKLVDDGLVDTDKIGTSVYFWAFPSKVIQTKKRTLETIETNYEQAKKKVKLLEKTLEDSKENNDASCEIVLDNIADMEQNLAEAKSKLQFFQQNDADKLEAQKKDAQTLKEAANRWTDNIFAVKSWCKKKFFMEDSTLNKQFGIPEDLDYLE